MEGFDLSMKVSNREFKSPVELGQPVRSISLDMTEGCSLRCKYCFADLDAKKKAEQYKLTEPVMKAVVDWLFDDKTSGTEEEVNHQGGLSVEFWGGEPLHNWDMVVKTTEYVEQRSKETGKKIRDLGGTTNVVEVTKERLDYMKEHKIHFLMSIDGIEECHDKYRVFPDGSGSWRTIDKKLDMILSYFPFWQARISLHSSNMSHLYESYEYFFSKGMYSAFYSPVYEADWTEEVWREYEVQVEKLISRVVREAVTGRQIQVKFLDDYVNYILSAWKHGIDIENLGEGSKKLAELSVSNRAMQPCGAGYRYMGISVDGQIYVCHRFNKHNMHHIKPEEKFGWLGNVYQGIGNIELWTKFHTWDVDKIDHCKDCKVRYNCKGGCYASNYDTSGAVDAKVEAACRFQFENYKLALKMIEAFKRAGLYDAKNFRLIYRRESQRNDQPHFDRCHCFNASYVIPDYMSKEMLADGTKSKDSVAKSVLGMATQVIEGVVADNTELYLLRKKVEELSKQLEQKSGGCVCKK